MCTRRRRPRKRDLHGDMVDKNDSHSDCGFAAEVMAHLRGNCVTVRFSSPNLGRRSQDSSHEVSLATTSERCVFPYTYAIFVRRVVSASSTSLLFPHLDGGRNKAPTGSPPPSLSLSLLSPPGFPTECPGGTSFFFRRRPIFRPAGGVRKSLGFVLWRIQLKVNL